MAEALEKTSDERNMVETICPCKTLVITFQSKSNLLVHFVYLLCSCARILTHVTWYMVKYVSI